MARSKQTDAIRRVLGPYQTWSLMFSRGNSEIERSTWKCGCTLDCVGNGRDNRHLATQWDRCGKHQEIAALLGEASDRAEPSETAVCDRFHPASGSGVGLGSHVYRHDGRVALSRGCA
jgi:hypothetical protein